VLTKPFIHNLQSNMQEKSKFFRQMVFQMIPPIVPGTLFFFISYPAIHT